MRGAFFIYSLCIAIYRYFTDLLPPKLPPNEDQDFTNHKKWKEDVVTYRSLLREKMEKVF